MKGKKGKGKNQFKTNRLISKHEGERGKEKRGKGRTNSRPIDSFQNMRGKGERKKGEREEPIQDQSTHFKQLLPFTLYPFALLKDPFTPSTFPFSPLHETPDRMIDQPFTCLFRRHLQ